MSRHPQLDACCQILFAYFHDIADGEKRVAHGYHLSGSALYHDMSTRVLLQVVL